MAVQFPDRTARRRCRYPADLGVKHEETQKNSKKQETELYVQVAEKPENQKENVGEALACFCIYVGWYLMVMQFCRASLAMILSGSVGAILLVMAVLVNGQKEKKFIRKIVHEILAAAVLCFLISFTIRKGWIFQGALIAGNGPLETIGRNMRAFEPDYALTISEPLRPFVTAVFYVTAGMVLATLLEFLRVSKSRIGTILVSLIPGVLLLIWQKETVLFSGASDLCRFSLPCCLSEKKKKGLAQLQTDVIVACVICGSDGDRIFHASGKASSFFARQSVLAESTEICRTDPLWEKDGGFPAGRTVPGSWKPETDR